MFTRSTQRLLLHSTDFIMLYEELAELLGLDKAVFLQKVHQWLNTESGRVVDGRRWIYNSYEDWQKQMPWWSVMTIRRMVTALEEIGLLVSKQLDRNKLNRTKWYTIDYERLDQILDNGIQAKKVRTAQIDKSNCSK